MSVERTRRRQPAAAAVRQRPVSRKQAGPRRRSRQTFSLVVMAVVALAIVLTSRFHDRSTPSVIPAAGIARPIQYTVVAGDTPASVASAYALNVKAVAAAAGTAGATQLLSPGLQLSIDALPLWVHISQGEPATIETLVENTARKRGVEPAFALAVAWQESRFDAAARSSTGAIGIMQLEPDTSKLASTDLGVPIDPRNPSDNILAGVFWLHSLLTSYGGDKAAALAAYYEGAGNLARHGYLAGTAGYVAHALQLRKALLAANPGLNS